MVASVAATAVSAFAPDTDAATVRCGPQVTASITVDNHLTNCPGKGLVVGADNITVDLNGHTIDGDEDPLIRRNLVLATSFVGLRLAGLNSRFRGLCPPTTCF